MSILTMDMSSYEVEGRETVPSCRRDEVFNAEQIPALGLREMHCEHVELPQIPRIGDVTIFLRKMYRCRR